MSDYEERDREADRIEKMYDEVEDEIIALLVAAFVTGLPERVREAALVSKSMLAQAKYQTDVWAAEAIPELYGEPTPISDVTVQRVAEASEARFADMSATTSRRIDDVVRDFETAHARRQALTAWEYEQRQLGRSVTEMARALEAGLRERGITAFTDAAGRKWRLSNYADMAARTTTMDAQLSGIKDRVITTGGDLVHIVGPLDYPDGCPASVLDGPYSLTGSTEGYLTLDQAIEKYGVFHPRCRHSLIDARPPD